MAKSKSPALKSTRSAVPPEPATASSTAQMLPGVKDGPSGHATKSPGQDPGYENIATGNAGELHQTAGGTHPSLTTNLGVVVADDENSLRIGQRGPTLLEDHILREKINHFDHERIPERVVHARGAALTATSKSPTPSPTSAKPDIFQRVGEKTRSSPASPPWPGTRLR